MRGEVYGLDGGWIWVEAPSVNDGEPVGIEVVDGSFDGPLGINSYGEHPFDGFSLGDETGPGEFDIAALLNDRLPGDPTVGPDEGSIFDDECFDLDVPLAPPE